MMSVIEWVYTLLALGVSYLVLSAPYLIEIIFKKCLTSDRH